MKLNNRVLPRLTATLLGAALTMSVASVSALEIVAHRGASFDAPENSLSAMKLAWEQKADGIETDIYLSKDNKIVVMHDADTKRTGGVTNKIVETKWNKLEKVDIGSWKGAQWKGETIPTLDALFATIPKSKKNCIFTEIKIQDTAILDELEKAQIASGKKAVQLRIITFHYDMAKAAKARFPEHPVYWLVGAGKDKKTGLVPNIDDTIAKAKEANLDGLDLEWKWPIDKAFVKKVHKAGLKLYTWTVDDAEVARAEVAAGVDGITTNRPEWLRQQLKSKK